MDLKEFLEWENDQELPFEFVDGQVRPLDLSTQERALLITDVVCVAKEFTRDRPMRVLSRMRVSIPHLQEVRYLDVVVDAGPYVAEALEPGNPVLVIDVGRNRDFSALEGVSYLSISSDAAINDVSEQIRAVLRSVRS